MQRTMYSIGWFAAAALFGCSEQPGSRNSLTESESSALQISQQTKLNALDAFHGDGFGNAVSILAERALIGASGDDHRSAPNDEGAVYLFEASGQRWIQRAKLVASDASARDRFGNAVALGEDTALVAASGRDIGSNIDQGAVYVFINDGTTWVERQTLVVQAARSGEGLGRSLGFEGDTAVVGANGSARIFERSGATFVESQKIVPPAGADPVAFGRTVALSGGTLLVGSSLDTVGANPEQGAVYVYERSGSGFLLKQRLVATDGQNLDHFGSALAISGEHVVVGIDSTKPASGGAAYVFERSGGAFSARAKLKAADTAQQDAFGRSVAILGELVVVGAPLHEHGGNNANHGSAYVFRRIGSQWIQLQEMFAADAQNNDMFASSVALTHGMALIGSPNDDNPFVSNGSAYTFRIEGFAGEPCRIAAECASGFCSDGVCCDTACSGSCDACSVAQGAQFDGFCAPVPAGARGEPACASACDGLHGECPLGTPCSTDEGCSSAEYCNAGGGCAPRKILGSDCSISAGADCREEGCRVCSGGTCLDGTCSLGVCAANVRCDANPCQHGGTCTDTPTGHVCSCPPGINGLDCEVVFTQLAGGHYDMCGLRSDGKIACWGLRSAEVPIVAPAGTFKWVSLSQHLCAVRTDGSALCQGYGATTPPALKFKSIYAGDMRACGILEDDTATCWNHLPAAPGTFKSLALGSPHTCGIRSDGSVDCWGLENYPDYDFGQGDPPAGSFISLTTSQHETCGITAGGSFACWGQPSSGLRDIPAAHPWTMLGNGFSWGCALRSDGLLHCTDVSSVPGTRSSVLNGTTGRYKTFAVSGAGFGCGLRVDDAVVCWGAETLTLPPTGSP